MEVKKQGSEIIRLGCAWRVFASLLTYFLSQAFIEFRVIDGRCGMTLLMAKTDGRHILLYNTEEID